MKELQVSLPGLGRVLMSDVYQSPQVVQIMICQEGILCQSDGVVSAGHDGFNLDEGNPEEVW